MKKEHEICEADKSAYGIFREWLPYYWTPKDGVPPLVRLYVHACGYANAASACIDIADHVIKDRALAKKAHAELREMQVWKGKKACSDSL